MKQWKVVYYNIKTSALYNVCQSYIMVGVSLSKCLHLNNLNNIPHNCNKVEALVVNLLSNFVVDCEQYEVVEIFPM